jgi:two-component system response regulator YesN
MGNSISKYNNINVKKIVLAIKEYINKNYCDSNISLNLIADEFCKSSVYISKLFKNETGENFIDYLTRLRMEKAKELLANSLNLKAFEIAQNIGYTDISHFNKLFKKYTGFSPIEYRERPNTDNEDVY